MLSKELAEIDFSKPAREVHNLVRGMNSWPVAHTTLGGKLLKVYRTRAAQGKGAPGELLGGKSFTVACGEGAVELVEIQAEGRPPDERRRLPAGASRRRGDQAGGIPQRKGVTDVLSV